MASLLRPGGGKANGSNNGTTMNEHHPGASKVRLMMAEAGGTVNNGVPAYNHADPADWLHKRSYYEKIK